MNDARPAAPTLASTLTNAARQHGDATALIDGVHRVSYADWEIAVRRLASGLLSFGLARGDRIGIVALNQVEWLQLFFAAAKIGVVVVGMSLRYRENELEYMVNDSNIKVVFTLTHHADFDYFAMWDRLASRLPALKHVIGIEQRASAGQPCLADFAAARLDPFALNQAEAAVLDSDLAMVIYTSGTTGRPKGAGLTHRSLLASAQAQATHMRLDASDLLQLAMPLNHVGGITCGILSMMLAGGSIDLIAEFEAAVVLDRMQLHSPTIVGGVPTMMNLLLMHAGERHIDWDKVRLIFVGGSNVDATLLSQLSQRMRHATLMNLYGLSESSGALVMTPWGCSHDDLMNSIGKPLGDAEVRILDAKGHDMPTGQVGELCFRGAGVIPGYVGSASASQAFDNEGWLHTGDLGQLNAQGDITMVGRAKDMYIQEGFKVYPAEIEAFIARHPKVMMVAGIGVPDAVLGEIGRYYIVPKPGGNLNADEIYQHCRQHFADYKVPRQIVLRDDLPMTPAGKIHKAGLRLEA